MLVFSLLRVVWAIALCVQKNCWQDHQLVNWCIAILGLYIGWRLQHRYYLISGTLCALIGATYAEGILSSFTQVYAPLAPLILPVLWMLVIIKGNDYNHICNIFCNAMLSFSFLLAGPVWFSYLPMSAGRYWVPACISGVAAISMLVYKSIKSKKITVHQIIIICILLIPSIHIIMGVFNWYKSISYMHIIVNYCTLLNIILLFCVSTKADDNSIFDMYLPFSISTYRAYVDKINNKPRLSKLNQFETISIYGEIK